MRVYNYGTFIGQDDVMFSYTLPRGKGRIGVGIHGITGYFASVEVDELRFYNPSLPDAQIARLSQNIA